MKHLTVLNQIKTILTVDSHPIVATGKLYMLYTAFGETGNQQPNIGSLTEPTLSCGVR